MTAIDFSCHIFAWLGFQQQSPAFHPAPKERGLAVTTHCLDALLLRPGRRSALEQHVQYGEDDHTGDHRDADAEQAGDDRDHKDGGERIDK